MDKFTISSKPVLLSFIHTGVFVPVSGRGSASDRYTFSPFNNPSMRLAYWDQDAYVSEFMLNSDDDPLSNPREGRTSSGGRPRGTVAAADEGLARQPKDGEGKTKKRKAEAGASSSNKKVRGLGTPIFPPSTALNPHLDGPSSSGLLAKPSCRTARHEGRRCRSRDVRQL